MTRQPTNKVPKSKKIEIDDQLKEKLKSVVVRKEIWRRVNAHELLESMKLTVNNRTVQKIQQTQQNNGTEDAARKFMDEVTVFDGWATAFLDALHYNGQDDLAKKLYKDYVPPTNDDDDDDDGQSLRVSPPKYTEADLQKTLDAKTIIVKDQSEKMAELQRKSHSLSSDQPLVGPTPPSVTQSRAKHTVPVTRPAASRPSSHQDTCHAMTTGEVIDKKFGSVAECYADDDNQRDYSFPTADFFATGSPRPSSGYCDDDIGSSAPPLLVQSVSNQNNDEQAAVPNISNPIDLDNVVDDESIRFENELKEDSSNVCLSDTRELNSDDDMPSITEDRE